MWENVTVVVILGTHANRDRENWKTKMGTI